MFTYSSAQEGDGRKMQCGQTVSSFELCHHYHPRDVFLWDNRKDEADPITSGNMNQAFSKNV
jgi:hypothetical protein